MSSKIVPPAKGLTYLTWAQLEQIDARLASLASYARETGQGVHLSLVLNGNGRLTGCGMPMLMEKLAASRN
jgi:hypothetical protein